MQDMPDFMRKDEWYYFDGKRFVLTEKAPPKVKASYNRFYEVEREIVDGGKGGK